MNDEAKRFLDTYEREHATTRRVLAAFPAERADFRPHERSNTALQLARTFGAEAEMMRRAIANEPLGGIMAGVPENWDDAVAYFDATNEKIFALLRGGAPLDGKVHFFVAKGKMGDVPAAQFIWFMMHDQIHHRGQLSVYVRMAGGKVPSIYGPSADEPWT